MLMMMRMMSIVGMMMMVVVVVVVVEVLEVHRGVFYNSPDAYQYHTLLT